MSIDELHEKKLQKSTDISLSEENTKIIADQEKHSALVPTRSPVTPAPVTEQGDGVPAPRTLSEQQRWALRRARVNHVLIRRRLHKRTTAPGWGPRLLVASLVLLAALLVLLSSGTGAAYAYYQAQLPLLNGVAQHSLFQTTRIYDRNGKLLKELYDQQLDRGRRTYVNYADISPLLVNATVAAEDHTFWKNNGVDFSGIARAAVANLSKGGVVEGGSTITQQLIKKQFFSDNNRTIDVKAEEAILATGLTQQYPKSKIMEMYLNTVYYGHLNYGVEAAAQDFFGIQPTCTRGKCQPAVFKLTLAQASLLAGLPQSPSYYDPTVNKDDALKRQAYVLDSMVDLGMATKKQAEDAKKVFQNYKFKSTADNRKTQAPHFIDYVVDQLQDLFGSKLSNGGYNVYTTLDLDLQKHAEQSVYNNLYTPGVDAFGVPYTSLSRDHNVNNGAVVVMNPANGEILSMVGSVNYNDKRPTVKGQFNVTTGQRQPGSSFKPFIYAAAIEKGWYPAMIVPDKPTVYPERDPEGENGYYAPKNYDKLSHTSKPMTIRTALGNSFNVPATTTYNYVGNKDVQNIALRMGLSEFATVPMSSLGSATALGSIPVSLLNMTSAYSTFANRGVRVPPTSILEITDNQGHPVYKYDEAKPKGVRALREDVSFLISSMLSDKEARYLEFLPGNALELPFPSAVKTGTTNGFKDNLTMGYTPHLAVGVWAGNSNGEEMRDVIGLTGAAPIWNDVMQYATKRYKFPPSDFLRPENVHAGTVSALSGLQPRLGEPTVTDWFIDGTMPTIAGNSYVPPTQPGQGPPKRQICIGNKCFPLN